MPACKHLNQIRDVTPSADGCEDCLKIGSDWVHLPSRTRLVEAADTSAWSAGTSDAAIPLRTEASVAAYKKALEIDPKFESSIKALEAIQKKKR